MHENVDPRRSVWVGWGAPTEIGVWHMSMYGVKFIEDNQLPEGTDWAMVQDRGDFLFMVKRSRISEAVLTEGWEAYRKLTAAVEVPVPRTA